MINELNHLSSTSQELQLLPENEGMQNSSAVQNKEIMVALSKIQLGEILSGKIIMENDQTVLKLQSGLKLLSHLADKAQPNQLLDFLVIGKGRQHLVLEPVQLMQSQKDSLEDGIMKELQLPQNDQMQKVVGQWMDKQLPLVKNQMLQLYQMAKNYHIPSEALANLCTYEMPLSEEEASLVAQFKSKGLQDMSTMVEDSLDKMMPDETIQFAKTIGQKLSFNDLKNIVKDLLVQLQGKSNMFDEKGGLTSANIPAQEKTAGEMLTGPSRWAQVLEEITQIKPSDVGSKNELLSVLEQVMNTLPKEKIKALGAQLLHKYITIDLEALDQNTEKEMVKLGETSQRIKEVLKDIEELVPEQRDKSSFQAVEQMAQALDKYNEQGQYYCFPMNIQNEQTSGELYFFKPKKNKNGKSKEDGMYIVLALDMPSLKQIEVHLVQKGESLELKIKVAKPDIQKQMEHHLSHLKELMDETMMPIEGIEIGLIEVPIHKKVSPKESSLNRLDFRI